MTSIPTVQSKKFEIMLLRQNELAKKLSKINNSYGLIFVETKYEKYWTLPNGTKHGKYQRLSADGRMKFEKIYNFGDQVGFDKKWFDGKLKSRHFMVGKIRMGEWSEWHKNGQLIIQGLYDKRGCRTGLWKEWYENGRLRSEQRYKNQKFNGHAKVWYQNGNLKECGNYIDDKKRGYWKVCYENGGLKENGSYGPCEKEGTWFYFRQRRHWRPLDQQSPSNEENTHRQNFLFKKEKWTDGTLVKELCWDKKGRKVSRHSYKKKKKCCGIPTVSSKKDGSAWAASVIKKTPS